jgi:hypothetical protein
MIREAAGGIKWLNLRSSANSREEVDVTITERAVLIRIPRLYRPTTTDDQLYEATRKWWRVNPARHDPGPDYAFSVVGGVVKAVYRIDGWEQPPAGERVG